MQRYLSIKPAETLAQFVARYALYRGVRMNYFMRHTMIDVWTEKKFDESVATLARLSGNTVETLTAHAVSYNNSTVNGQDVNRRSLEHRTPRCCTKCLKDDHEPTGSRPFSNVHFRAAWLDLNLTVCPDHAMPIVSIVGRYQSQFRQDFSSAVVSHWRQITNAEYEATEVRYFDRYFAGRLNNRLLKNDLLDGLPYYAAMKVCEAIGCVSLYGFAENRTELTFEQKLAAKKLGADMLVDGYPDLKAFLMKRDKQIVGTVPKAMGRLLYGDLYLFLRNRTKEPEFQPIIDFMHKHVVAVHPFGPKSMFLGRPGTHQIHTVASAAREANVHVETLKRLLRDGGLLADGADQNIPTVRLDLKVVRKLMRRWGDGLFLREAADRLRASFPLVTQLAEAGYLGLPDSDTKTYLSANMVEKFVADLDAIGILNPAWDDPKPLRGCTPFAKYTEILQAVFDGQLKLGILKSEDEPTNLSHLVVSLGEVKSWAGVSIPDGHMKCWQVTARLKVNKATVIRLFKLGVLPGIVCKERRNKELPAFEITSVDEFARTYISQRAISNFNAEKERPGCLTAKAVPAYDFGGRERLYERSILGS